MQIVTFSISDADLSKLVQKINKFISERNEDLGSVPQIKDVTKANTKNQINFTDVVAFMRVIAAQAP